VRVAVVSPYAFDAPGGVQDQVARIVRWLREEGDEAWAVAPGEGGPEGTRSVGSYQLVPANRSRAPIALSPFIGDEVERALEGAEVTHVHEPFMPMTSVAALRRAPGAVVGTFHADPGPGVRRLYRAGAVALRRLARHIDVATAVSAVAADAIDDLVEARIVPNGIDLERYRGGGERQPGRVLFIGRDEERKGLDVLLQAWPMIRAAEPGARLRVNVERPAGPVGVEFLGRLSEEDKLAELRSAAVLVAPNLGGESFGIVVLEGLAAGCAVVASDLPAFRAVAGDAARYAAPGRPYELADAVTSALRSGPTGGEAAAARRFGRDAVLAGYLGAYRDALAASGAAQGLG
jgi:phosphatidylinositol alpha-mannosyltransferase